MIRTEIKTKSSIVRIHDEYCNAPSEGCISHLNQIVSNYYKRRNISEEAVAVQDENKFITTIYLETNEKHIE